MTEDDEQVKPHDKSAIPLDIDETAVDDFFDSVFSATLAIQKVLPDAVRIGGSAIYAYAQYRESIDADHVIRDLDKNWGKIKSQVEEIEGWITTYSKIPINFMGKINGLPVSIRKLNRIKEIETVSVTYKGETVRIASLPELDRLKCMAILSRSLTKDYIDLLKLHEKHNIVQSFTP